MKTTVRLLLLSAALAAGAQAAPFLAVSDNSEVFLTGTLGVREDSNIYLSHGAVSDTIWDVDPGFQFVFGNTSAAKGTLSVVDNIATYSSHSALNSNLLGSAFNVGYEDGKTKAAFNASYNELNQNTFNVNTGGTRTDALIRRNVTMLGGSGELSVTEKTSVSAGATFERTDYRLNSFSDEDQFSIPLNYYYEVTPKLDASLGYTYRASWQQLNTDSVDNFYNVGVRGEITPKLSGHINVGVTDRRFTGKVAHLNGLSSVSLFGIDSNLTYAVSPKATLQLSVNNDFDTNAQGDQQKDFSISGSGAVNLSEEWTLNATLTWRNIKFANNGAMLGDRTDDFWDAQAGATYKINSIVSITVAVAYRENDSGHAARETNGAGASSRSFKGTVWSLAANFRY